MSMNSLSVLGGNFATKADLETAGGLVLIDEESFSAVSSVSLNNVFSATYQNYRLVIDATQSNDIAIYMRLRASGTDNSTASSYKYVQVWGRATNTGGYNFSTGTTQFDIYGGWSGGGIATLDIIDPYVASMTHYSGICAINNTSAGYTAATGGGTHTVTSSFDGFTLYPASGTITGTIRVYGYKGA